MDNNLKNHTVKSYDKDLKSISDSIEDLLKLAIQSIDMTSSVIGKAEDDFVQRIKKHDYKINSLDSLVEKKVTSMLALRQPMAVDLRYVVCALKVSSNLERIGDKSKSVVKKLNHIGHEIMEEKVKKALFKMLDCAKEMVNDAVISFNEHDVKKADKVLKADDKIDQIYQELFLELIDHDKLSREELKTTVNTLFIAKSFERLADHAVNIAEITHYVVSGELIEDEL
ncbi:MAG: phosphate signaling complex protein PhoU [Proteobacteria bacterium]|nr:phosphate signaling complex protein PhoU [Pseudomonadota bacterium]